MPNNDKDILNQTWYHANVSNEYIKILLKQNGDFLVRNSIHLSKKYSLSIYWNEQIHHLRINEYEIKNEKFFYLNSKTDSFKLISELIEFYRLICKPVSDSKLYLILLNGIQCVSRQIIDGTNVSLINSNDDFDYEILETNHHILNQLKKSFKYNQKSPLKLKESTTTTPTTQTMFNFSSIPVRTSIIKDKESLKEVQSTKNNRISSLNLNDINLPNSNLFKTVFNLNDYECNLINDKTKRLDRFALSEINSLMSNVDSNPLFAFNLSVLLTKEDLDLLGYDHDYGLGVLNGLELICLVQGDVLRADLIDRHNTFTLFIALIICICQIDELRVGYLILWIDCAFYLFDKLKNFYAFSYVMNALNHTQVKRLNGTWNLLKQTNEVKYKLFENLNIYLNKLNNGEYVLLENESLIPNIYPILLLLLENIDKCETNTKLKDDFNVFKSKTDLYLAQNARYFINNSNAYSLRSESFLRTYYSPLFTFKFKHLKLDEMTNLQKNLLKLTFLTQTEFQQILLWSHNFSNYLACDDSTAFINIINQRINDVNTILSILSLKIEK